MLRDSMTDTERRWRIEIIIAFLALLAAVIGTAVGMIALNHDRKQNRDEAILASTNQAVALQALSIATQDIWLQQQIATTQSEYLETLHLPETTHVVETVQVFQATQTSLAASALSPITQPAPTILAKYTNTPAYPTPEAYQEIQISQLSTATFFDGQLYITLLWSSSSKDEVIAKVFTPGFPELVIDHFGSGFSKPYRSTGIFEISILGYDWNDNVRFQVTYLGPTQDAPRIIKSPQLQSIRISDTGSFFGRALRITVKESSRQNNNVDLVINSSGMDSVPYNDLQVGASFMFDGKDKYEVRILTISPYNDSVEFIVSKMIP